MKRHGTAGAAASSRLPYGILFVLLLGVLSLPQAAAGDGGETPAGAVSSPAPEVPAMPDPAADQVQDQNPDQVPDRGSDQIAAPETQQTAEPAWSESGIINRARLFLLVQARAEELAARPYKTSGTNVPQALLDMDLAAWEGIRFKPEHAPWQGMGLPFSLSFFTPGSIYKRSVNIQIVEEEGIRPFRPSRDMFDFGPSFSADKLGEGPVPCAGFSLIHLPPYPAEKWETASFLGATYFRGKGKNSDYGLSARGLALNTALPEGEEFPHFREFWLVKPQAGDTSFTLLALLDSPGMAGAYLFTITPGSATVMDVRCRLFPRGGVPAKIGLAAMNSMFFNAANGERPDGGGGGDGGYPRSAGAHSSDGLQWRSADDTWLWRPLANPSRLMVSRFSLPSPTGFGLLQRDGNPAHYQGTSPYARQPSLWVEPQGDWGAGDVELVEIPTRSAIHSNIYAYWVPLPSGSEEGAPPSLVPGLAAKTIAYRLYWMEPGVTPHRLGRVAECRIIRSPAGDTARFLVDYDGEDLRQLPESTGLTSIVETPEQAPLIEKKLLKNQQTGLWRLDFTVRLPKSDVVQSIIAAREGVQPLRFKALLKKGENIPQPLTETWVYDLPLY